MTESNIFFGTAFPEQTERDKRIGVSDSGQFVPVWKQEARDEKGRRRFHGAFTGGFSAGYFNTVGSKEGWTPSQYVSSRSSRNEKKAARPEDFMDEEDLQELASSKRLVATEEFDILGGTERELLKRKQIEEEGQKSGLSFLSSSLMDLVTPTKDSIGMTLLKKMGWKPGQGIGPRILQSIEENDDDNDQMVSLAPKDTPIVEYKQKTDVYGLGYDLISNVPQVAEMYRYQQLKKEQQDEGNKSKKRKSRMGFGVGVFEDEDEDMMDFNMNDDDDYINRNYHRTLYEDEDDNDQYNGYPHLMKSKRSNNDIYDNDHLKKKRCSDGHLPLKGFHVSTQSQELGRWFEPPKVPSSFDGFHKSTTIKSTTSSTPKGELTMDARGALLGETPIEPRSVFDYMSQKSKEQLERAKTLSSTKESATFINTSKLQVTLIPANTAQLALKGFIPFGDQPEKQSRYKQYLELCVQKNNTSSLDNEIEIDIPKGLTHESGMKEIDEFIKAARIFRPISSMMSNRFTSASSNGQHLLNNQGGQVEHITFEGGLKTEEQYRKEKELKQKLIENVPKPKLSQEAEAAAMNMFGPLTRKVKPFYPNRLVCKRFNIKNPHPDYVQQTPGHRTQAGSTNILNDQMMQSMFQQQQQYDDPLKMKQPIGFLTVNENDPALKLIIDKPSMRKDNEQNEMDSVIKENKNEEKEEDDEDDNKLDYKRPTMDIFKAIFENDDDSEDEEDEEDEYHDKNQVNKTTLSTTTSTNTLEEKERNHNKYNNNSANNIDVDEDSFIGPPLPPLPSSSINNDHDRDKSNIATDIPFKPKFTKREDQTTTPHPTISDEKIHITTPFQPRLTSSKAPKRRHIQVSSDEDGSDDNKYLSSDTYTSDDDHHSDVRQQKTKHSKSSKRQKSDDEDRSHRHRRKHDRKKKKKSRKHDDYYDSEEESKRRKKKKRSKDHEYSDNNGGLDEKSRHKSSSSSRHRRKNEREHHHRHHKEKEEKKLEDDISLWVEKQPVTRRSRAEDLW